MNELFADTSGWACWLDRAEPFHALAVSIVARARASGRPLITTNYVLTELVALLTSPLRISRPQQIQFLGAIRSATWVEVVHIDAALDATAWSLW